MSKMFILGLAGAAALGSLAILPQISTAATGAAPSSALFADAGEATQTHDSAGSSAPGAFGPAFSENGEAYRTCFMKRSVSFTREGPKAVTARSCAD